MGLTLVLGVILLALWLVLSGHYTALLITFGVLSVSLVVWVASRMRLTDPEGVFVHLFPGLVGYWAWLVKEIFVCNVQVARIVLSPSLPIGPAVVHYSAHQRSDVARVLFANSITLTPGTITTGVDGQDFRIHALAWRFVDGVEEGEMDRRVVALEGSAPDDVRDASARVVDPDAVPETLPGEGPTAEHPRGSGHGEGGGDAGERPPEDS